MGQMGMGSTKRYGIKGLTPSEPYFMGLKAPEKPTKKAKIQHKLHLFWAQLMESLDPEIWVRWGQTHQSVPLSQPHTNLSHLTI